MRMQPYDMVVLYRSGHDNPADYLSRHPVKVKPSGREEKIAEEYMNYVVTISTPKAMTVEEVANETAKDPTLTAVTNALTTNQWLSNDDKIDHQTFRTLYLCRSELSLAHNTCIVLKGRQIVLPQSLHQKAVNIAHSGHQGIVKTVALLREKSWFRGMQSLVEQTVKKCMSCQVTTLKVTREPPQMSSLPKAPWTELSADFGHLPNGHVLFVQDEYARLSRTHAYTHAPPIHARVLDPSRQTFITQNRYLFIHLNKKKSTSFHHLTHTILTDSIHEITEVQ